jgi:hypothetical protein
MWTCEHVNMWMWILTSAFLSVAIVWPVGLAAAGQPIDHLVKQLSSTLFVVLDREPASLARSRNIVDNVLFLAILLTITTKEIFSTILSTMYFLSGLCVWRIYVYFLITCWMLQLSKVLNWWIILLIFWSITWVGPIDYLSIDQRDQAKCFPKKSSADSGASLKTETLKTFTNNSQDSTMNEIAVVNFNSRFQPIIKKSYITIYII